MNKISETTPKTFEEDSVFSASTYISKVELGYYCLLIA
jgi:hypothetical protein